MAAWCDDMRWSDSDQRDDRLEDYGQHVSVEAFYPDWDGTLTDAFHTTPVVGLEPSGETTAYTSASVSVLLLHGVDRVIALLGERSAA